MDQASQDIVNKMELNQAIKCKIAMARNYENHKRFFSFINATFDMQEFYDDVKVYRKWLTMKAGHFDTCVAPNGYTMFLPKSISFESMEEPEFQELFSKCIDVFLAESRLSKGISREQIMRVVDYA